MKKRIGYAILTVILCLAMVFALAACDSEDKITTAPDGDNSTASNDDSTSAPDEDDSSTIGGDGTSTSDEDGTQTPHEHTYAEAWSNDETHHWHAVTCEHNDEKSDYAEHTWGEGVVTTPATCCSGTMTYTCVCGATKTEEISPVTAHAYSTEWSNNETHHWHAATCEHSDEKNAYAGHTYGADHICTVCAYQVTPTDGLEYTLNSDEMSYSVSGIGTATDTNIVIAATYKNLPITSIGEEAFYNCMRLTSITIPDGVTSIGGRAFQNCTSLSSITIPNSVTSIDDWAFLGCSSLTSVHISDIAAWCNIAFKHSSSNPLSYAYYLYLNGTLVTDLVIPDSVTSIGDWTFSGCRSLTSITISNSVTSIGEDAFRDCWNLTSITIPDGVTSIGDYAFYECSSLTGVYISDIAAWCNIAFKHSSSNPLSYAYYLYLNGALVTDLVIPGSVTSIGDYAFYECSSLISITIPDSVTSIGEDAFEGCTGLTSITIPDSVTSIGDYAFRGCTNLTYTTFDNAKYLGNENTPYLVLIDVIDPSVTSFTMQESTKIIYDDAFYGCTSLTSITIPDSVTSIGSHAFYGCTSLTSITIPNSVTSIGDWAFHGCSSLTSITIGDGVTSIGWAAFFGCDKLVEVYNCSALTITKGSSDFGDVGYYALNIYTPTSGESKLRTTEDGYVFYVDETNCYLVAYHGNATDLTLPANYQGQSYEIYQYAFSDCTSLTSVTIPDSVTSIGEDAFRDCWNLTSITLPDSVTSIGNYAFYNCSSLTSITIPDSVTSIGSGAFYHCTSLTSITIGDGVTSIGRSAFYYCTNLTNVTISDGVTSIGDSAFDNCDSLTDITLPDSITSIGSYAFDDCTRLDTVYYTGTPAEWDAISIDTFNYDLTSATRYYYSENEPTTSGNYWHYVEGVPTPWGN